MDFGTMMALETLLIIVLVIATSGTLIAQLSRYTSRPYLLTITGTRAELISAGVLIWLVAIGLGIAVLFLASALISSIVGLALFFGTEAVALDILTNRTRYVRTTNPEHGVLRSTAKRP